MDATLNAVAFCEHSRIYSANTMKDYLEHQASLNPSMKQSPATPTLIPADKAEYHIMTQKRPHEVYARMGVR